MIWPSTLGHIVLVLKFRARLGKMNGSGIESQNARRCGSVRAANFSEEKSGGGGKRNNYNFK